jgi:hypothetical protein
VDKVKGDTSLQEKPNAEGADPVAIAKQAESTLCAEDVQSMQLSADLSDNEHEEASGGQFTPCIKRTAPFSKY